MGSYFVVLIIYLVIVNFLSVLVTLRDKTAAKKREFRIPENALMFLSVMGGSVAVYLTMITIRHKTRHVKFMLGIPIIILLQAASFVGVYMMWGNI